MSNVICAECGNEIEYDSLNDVAENADGEPIHDTHEVNCKSCDKTLTLGEITELNRHENGGFVCGRCPTVELPTEVYMEFTGKETYDNTWLLREEFGIDPDKYDGGNLWNIGTWETITFRITEDHEYEAIAVNGKEVKNADN
jgi:DNA-directed RNA polymerase subunit RPC12/RpoP